MIRQFSVNLIFTVNINFFPNSFLIRVKKIFMVRLTLDSW